MRQFDVFHKPPPGHELRWVCEPYSRVPDSSIQQGSIAVPCRGRQQSVDSPLLAICGNNRVQVVDMSTCCVMWELRGATRWRCVAITPCAKYVLLGDQDGFVHRHCLLDGADVSHIERRRKDVVRSVFLCPHHPRLAIGGDRSESGYVALYNVEGGKKELLCEFTHKRGVWCVRIDCGARLLAAAGSDSRVVVYDLSSFAMLQMIDFSSGAGRSDIRSLAFSTDGARLAVGSWNGNAHVYDVMLPGASTAPSPEPHQSISRSESEQLRHDVAARLSTTAPHAAGPGGEVLREVAVVERDDHVYAVALDANGRHLAVGGADKFVALYELKGARPPRRSTPTASPKSGLLNVPTATVDAASVVWQTRPTDAIYSVALSSDCQFCCYGGCLRSLIVLDGKTGAVLYQHKVSGLIWAVSMLEAQPGMHGLHDKLAIAEVCGRRKLER